MNEFLANYVMWICFLCFIEGIDTLIHKTTNIYYKISHVLFPLCAFVIMLRFLLMGVFA